MEKNIRMRSTTAAWTLAMALALVVVATQAAQAQTFNPIFKFQ